MKEVVLALEDGQYAKLQEVCDFSSEELRRTLMKGIALMAYRAEKISLAKAAELAGVSLWEMMDELRRMGLPVHEYAEEDWEMEKEAIESLR